MSIDTALDRLREAVREEIRAEVTAEAIALLEKFHQETTAAPLDFDETETEQEARDRIGHYCDGISDAAVNLRQRL